MSLAELKRPRFKSQLLDESIHSFKQALVWASSSRHREMVEQSWPREREQSRETAGSAEPV